MSGEIKHSFEPTDSQGCEMCCIRCGKNISIYNPEEWDKALTEKCDYKFPKTTACIHCGTTSELINEKGMYRCTSLSCGGAFQTIII